jgi:uncharacterized protein (TIGR03083 family)
MLRLRQAGTGLPPEGRPGPAGRPIRAGGRANCASSGAHGGGDNLGRVAGDPVESRQRWTDLGRARTDALAETWASLAEAVDGLRPEEWGRPTDCPGWTVQDQLSHLIGLERALDGEAEPSGDASAGDHVKNEFAAHNEKWIAARRGEPGEAVRAEFIEVNRRRLATLRGLTEEEWGQVGPTIVGEVAYAEFLKTRVFDSWVHEQDVRLALGRPGGSGGAASAIGLGQVQSAMGFVVGKKAGAPEGAVVRFSVSGPGSDAREFALAVRGGRAGPADPADVPTVTLTMPSLAFVRLGCGRATAAEEEAGGGVQLGGDAALGWRILQSMNFMF